ncbi:hypothetical protein M569_09533, partial [Genlisea aurea]
ELVDYEAAEEVPSWKNQITVRAVVVSVLLSFLFNVIVCKLNLSTGVIPSLNVAAGLLGFAMVKSWTYLISKFGLLKQPFTRQENTVIQTCVVASSGIAFSSGTASYLLAMSPYTAAQVDAGNNPINVKPLSLGWMIAFLFIMSFVGLFSIAPMRKLMILKYKLTYPSGTATACLINSFHTSRGAKLAKKKVRVLFKTMIGSFIWACFQWFFSAAHGCGFDSFPTFGLPAYRKRFYFDFSGTYTGIGMICPYMVNVSLLIGAIISWGILWPYIESKKGSWFSADLPAGSLHGIQGYRVFLAIAMILGDGLFHLIYVLSTSVTSFIQKSSEKKPLNDGTEREAVADYEEKKRIEFFLKDQIPDSYAIVGYMVSAAISIGLVPVIFEQIKWYHVSTAYAIAPILAFCNAYGCGLTDWSLASNYGKIAILVFSSWVGMDGGGIVAGLVGCGLTMSIVSTASDLMQDFKTGYLTLSSPRSMFLSQVMGTAVGCVFSPVVFWFFHEAYRVGDPEGSFPAPYAAMYRGIGLLGTEGLSSLQSNCVRLAAASFAGAVAIDAASAALRRYETRWGLYRFVPNPTCVAVAFYLGGYFAIDMCVGSLILFVLGKEKAKELGGAAASG